MLANIYLHYVIDLWAERWRRCEATGDMIIVRYADDIIVGFEQETDARRFLDAMRERLRSQKHSMTWERFTQLANDWLPKPRILHPWPERRFAVKHPRWEPYA
jgi:hypothetical protein